MKRLPYWIVLALIFCGVDAAAAWHSVLQASVGSAYVGPGDVVSGANFWISCTRSYSAAYATGANKACNIRRASDNATTDVNILASGAFDTATAVTFCASTSCFVTKAYDQTGHGDDAVQATAGTQPQLVFNCINTTLPCIKNTGTNYLLASGGASVSQPLTYSIVARMIGAGGKNVMGSYPTANATIQVTGATTWLLYGGGVLQPTFTVTDSIVHSVQAVFSDASSYSYVDGTATSLSIGNSAGSTTLAVFADTNAADQSAANSLIGEAGQWPAGFTGNTSSNGLQTGLMQANQKAYYGTP